MSDQYIPRGNTTLRPSTVLPSTEPYRADVRIDVAAPASSEVGGFSTGVLVAIVLVVVAIIAAVVFSNREMFGIGSGAMPPEPAPAAVTIENNVSPAETAVDPVAPAPAPEPAPALVQPATPVAPVAPATP